MPCFLILGLWACLEADVPTPSASAEASPTRPEPPPLVVQHVRNLRFRDNPTVFNESAAWLDAHREEALPVMSRQLPEGGPASIGIARVLGGFDDPRTVPALEVAMGVPDDELAWEAARALARTGAPAAADALRRGTAGDEVGVALRGIELRGDPSLCDSVRPHVGAPGSVGAYAARAASTLACDD